jgi:hypothetical protein
MMFHSKTSETLHQRARTDQTLRQGHLQQLALVMELVTEVGLAEQ